MRSKFQALPVSEEMAVIALVHDEDGKDTGNGFLLVPGLSPDSPNQINYVTYALHIDLYKGKVAFRQDTFNEKEISRFLSAKNCYAHEIEVPANKLQDFLISIQTFGEEAEAEPENYALGKKVAFFSEIFGHRYQYNACETAFQWARSALLKTIVQDRDFQGAFPQISASADSFKSDIDTVNIPSVRKVICNIF